MIPPHDPTVRGETTGPPPPPADAAARHRVVGDLTTNLFVEAGAGAGKTTSLIERIVALVVSGVELESIAAITFTEKAAAELRHKLRGRLGAALANDTLTSGADLDGRPTVALSSLDRTRLTAAVGQLDQAPIGTLHAFARRLLNEYPIAAELPPGFAVMDEIESNIRFDDRWEQFLDDLLGADEVDSAIDGGSRLYALCGFDTFGIIRSAPAFPSAFERIAHDFQDNWDLVEQRVDASDPGFWTPNLSNLIADCRRLGASACPDGDTQVARCANIAAHGSQLANANTLAAQLTEVAALAKTVKSNDRVGNATNWRRAGLDLDAIRAAQNQLRDDAEAVLAAAREYRKRLVGAILARWVLDSARERRKDGAIEFHDLLVLTRQLLRTNPAVRSALHHRYRRVLLDEFQDTDPIQLEIAVRLTAQPDDPHQSGDHGDEWRLLRPLPGRLFIVGDPKQSIYRFRRADIEQYLSAAQQLGSDQVTLSANFRSTDQIIDWVNAVFGIVITEAPKAQPRYQPLDAERIGRRDCGSVRLLGVRPISPRLDDESTDDAEARAEHETSTIDRQVTAAGKVTADDLREAEAHLVTGAIKTALAEGWPVRDHDRTRPCELGDICVLLPARTSLPFLERALNAAEIPYRAENSSIVYTTTEIRDLMTVLHAIDDPTDELRLVAALRSPLYGVSDVELYRWRNGGGRWRLFSPPPDGLEQHPVAIAYAHLAPLARTAWEHTPADLLATIVDDRRVLDAALDQPDSRDVWRRIRFVIEQARAWSDSGGHGLRRYLAWVHRQATEARTGDTVLPEHDHDAVRLMTIHAAKGLQFPVTILSGMTTRPRRQSGYGVAWPDGGWLITKRDDDPDYEDFAPVDELMGEAERRRLLYVACTRAEDHLVVSVVHEDRPGMCDDPRTSAEVILCADTEVGDRLATPLDPSTLELDRAHPPPPELPHRDFEEWRRQRADALRSAERAQSISATALASGASASGADRVVDPGLEKEPVDLDLPAWQRGRYGTAVGRAVHAVLQFCDLATGADIDAFAAAQCSAEGILGMDQLVADLARSAIAAPIVRSALTTPHHRELFVAAPIGDRTLEGYVDLFIETPDGGIIVDYKTDRFADDAEQAERIAKYRLQLAGYGLALERVLGRAPRSAILVRCIPGRPAQQIEIDNWDSAIAEARSVGEALTGGIRRN